MLQTILDSFSAKNASFAGNPLVITGYEDFTVILKITNVGTSPTLDVKVQVSDNGADWADLYDMTGVARQLVGFAQINAIGNYALQFSVFTRLVRLYYTIGGTTPSFTGSATVTAKREIIE